jgi:hypothetical protein
MKSYMKILMVFVLVLMLGSIVSAYSKGTITELANVKVTLINQDPDPIEPGRVVDVKWKVENIGGDAANDFVFKVEPKYPFSLYGDDAEKDLGTVNGRQLGDEGVIVRYQLLVDENSPDGYSEVPVMFKFKNQAGDRDWMKFDDDTFTIKIQSPAAILNIRDVKTNPAKVAPGEKTRLSISLENAESSSIENIKIKLNLDDVPFSPIGGSNQKSILTLNPEQTKIISFDLTASATASSQVHKIPVKIEYSDRLRSNYSQDSVVSILVNQEPTWYATIESSSVYVPKTKGDVSVKFVNNGPVDIKFLNTILTESKDYIVLSTREQYVGNIDSDDYETTDFKLYITNKVKEVVLPLEVSYLDSNNNEYSEIVSLKLPIYSTTEAKKLGLIQGSKKTGLFIIILIVGVGAWWYLKKRRKNKKSAKA